MTVYGVKLPKMAALLFWVVIWEIIGRFELMLLFPPFTEVLGALGEVVTTPSFAEAARITVYCYLMGLAIAAVSGTDVASGDDRSHRLL